MLQYSGSRRCCDKTGGSKKVKKFEGRNKKTKLTKVFHINGDNYNSLQLLLMYYSVFWVHNIGYVHMVIAHFLSLDERLTV